MASFTTKIKEEISNLETHEAVSLAELSAYIKYSNSINDNKLILFIENASVARRIFNLIKKIYNVNINLTIRSQKRFNVKTIYILTVNEKIDIIKSNTLDTFNKIRDYDRDEMEGYLRGIFLACGSINDPSKSKYHLEFLVSHKDEGMLTMDLLANLSFNSKMILRDKGYMVYIKASEEISDFIKLLGAINSLFYYEDIRIYRDHKNMVNRLNNCEQANANKSMKTCFEQMKQINYLEENDLITLLDDKTKLVIEYRKKYPETTLSELAEIISIETDMKITKSGINHHFRKIKELVNRHKSI